MKEKELLLKELNKMMNYYSACLQMYGNGQHDYIADIEKVKRSINELETTIMKEREQKLIEILTDKNVTEEGKEKVYDDFLRDFPFYDSSKLDRYFL